MHAMRLQRAGVAAAALMWAAATFSSQAYGDVAPRSAALATSRPATPAPTVQLQGGDSIAVVIQSDIGSRISKQGDTFAVITADDYMVDGKLVLPKGSPGYGEITHLKPAGAWRAAGELRFSVDRLVAPDGTTIVTITNGDTADAQVHYERNGSDTAQWLIWGGLGASHKKGDDMLVTAGSTIHVVVSGGRSAPVCLPGTAPAKLDVSVLTIPLPSPTP